MEIKQMKLESKYLKPKYSVIGIEEDSHGTTVLVRFPEGHPPNPNRIVWNDSSGKSHTFYSYGRLARSSASPFPEGYTYWAEESDVDVEFVNIISVI